VCPLGHVYPARPNDRTRAERPRGCPECGGKRVTADNSLATVAPWLETEYCSDNAKGFHEVSYASNTKCKWACTKGHIYWATPYIRTSKKPTGCSRCSNRHSRAELDIHKAVQEKYPDALSGQRSLLEYKRLELDVYVPSLKKAIEFDGTYWHSLPERKILDARKNEQCTQAGIQLLRIPEAEYESNPTETVAKIIQWLDTPTPPVT
jgi:very-short-patch-repair endonuclease